MRYLLSFGFFLVLNISGIAQNTCSAIVRDALEVTGDLCDQTGRNELCFGNSQIDLTMYSDTSPDFDDPGDMISVLDVASIRTSPYIAPDEWGIALMSIQANLPDTLPGQNVTFLLFGDVEIESATSERQNEILMATTTGSINVRAGSSTNTDVVDSLPASTELELLGRNEAADWVYFTTGDAQGWLYAPLLDIDDDLIALDVVSDDFSIDSIAPMQAIYFSTGVGASGCVEAPESGILLQTPEYDEPIELLINDVEIKVGSTLYLQAQAGGVMTLYVLEGEAQVTSSGVTWTVPEGAVVTIPLDDSLSASDIPNEPEPYTEDDVSHLPVGSLSGEIDISEPASSNRIRFENQCRGTLTSTVNARSGPGTNYPVATSFDANSEPRIIAQATGTDGLIWYRVSPVIDLWIRSDLLTPGATCDDIPFTDDIPEVPAPVTSTINNEPSNSGQNAVGRQGDAFIPLTSCHIRYGGTWPNPVSPDVTVHLNWGDGEPENISAILSGAVSFTATLDGVNLGPPSNVFSETYTDGGCPIGAAGTWSIGPLSSGTHQIVGVSLVNSTLNNVWECPTNGANRYTASPGQTQGPFVCNITVP